MSQTYDYFGNINHDLLNKIPLSASTILEVGCGSGALGAAYKALNPMSTYVGIEYVSEAAQIAQGRINHVVCGDVEDPHLVMPLVDGEKYDCLIYGDVLEHLRDPWVVLQRHLDLLSDSGIVWHVFLMCSIGVLLPICWLVSGPWLTRGFSIEPTFAGSPVTPFWNGFAH